MVHRFLKCTSQRNVSLFKKFIEASKRLSEQQGASQLEHHIEQRCLHGREKPPRVARSFCPPAGFNDKIWSESFMEVREFVHR